MPIIKTEGILIKKYKYKEKDKLLTIFTPENGKILVLCKGARNPLNRWGSSTEPPNYSFIQIYEKNGFNTLTEIKTLVNFNFQNYDLSRLYIFDYFANIIDWFLPISSPSRNTFNLLSSSLYLLENQNIDPIVLSYLFLLRFINIQGYKIEMNHCCNCRKRISEGRSYYFIFEEGSLICEDCIGKTESLLTRASMETINSINGLINLDINNISAYKNCNLLKNSEIDKIITGYYSFIYKKKIIGISEILKKINDKNVN